LVDAFRSKQIVIKFKWLGGGNADPFQNYAVIPQPLNLALLCCMAGKFKSGRAGVGSPITDNSAVVAMLIPKSEAALAAR